MLGPTIFQIVPLFDQLREEILFIGDGDENVVADEPAADGVAVPVEVWNGEVAAAGESLFHEVVKLPESVVAYGNNEGNIRGNIMGIKAKSEGKYFTFFVVFCDWEICILDCWFYHPVAKLALFSVIIQKHS